MKTFKTSLKFIAFSFLCFTGITNTFAQDTLGNNASNPVGNLTNRTESKVGESHFMIVGLTTFGFVQQVTTNTYGGIKTKDNTNSITDADRFEFSPMFLWRHGDNMLLEFEPSFDGTSLGVNWADVSYFIAPGLIARGGYLVLPFGIYNKRLAAGWINKLASDPIGMDLPGSDFGVELEGGLPLGSMKWSYDVALSNGFQLNHDGTIQGVGATAIQNGKTVSGRVALLPLCNSSLEIGLSGLYGSLATPVGAIDSFKNPLVSMYAVDLDLIKYVGPLQFNIKGQYNISSISKQNYLDTGMNYYNFTNTTNAGFGQLSIRPALSNNKYLKNLEFAYRYVTYTSPSGSTWGQNYTESDFGIDYWLSWRTVVKCTYENVNFNNTSAAFSSSLPLGTSTINRFIIQFSTEF